MRTCILLHGQDTACCGMVETQLTPIEWPRKPAGVRPRRQAAQLAGPTRELLQNAAVHGVVGFEHPAQQQRGGSLVAQLKHRHGRTHAMDAVPAEPGAFPEVALAGGERGRQEELRGEGGSA